MLVSPASPPCAVCVFGISLPLRWTYWTSNFLIYMQAYSVLLLREKMKKFNYILCILINKSKIRKLTLAPGSFKTSDVIWNKEQTRLNNNKIVIKTLNTQPKLWKIDQIIIYGWKLKQGITGDYFSPLRNNSHSKYREYVVNVSSVCYYSILLSALLFS